MYFWYSLLRFIIGLDILIIRFVYFFKVYWIILCIFFSVRYKGRIFWKVNRYFNYFRIIKMVVLVLVINGYFEFFCVVFGENFLRKILIYV